MAARSIHSRAFIVNPNRFEFEIWLKTCNSSKYDIAVLKSFIFGSLLVSLSSLSSFSTIWISSSSKKDAES